MVFAIQNCTRLRRRDERICLPRLFCAKGIDKRFAFGTMVHSYLGWPEAIMIEVERVQTGVRMEKRLLKVLKAFAELKDITLGDLLEGIVLHAFEGKAPFGKESLAQIGDLKKIYGMTLRAADSHKLKEKTAS